MKAFLMLGLIALSPSAQAQYDDAYECVCSVENDCYTYTNTRSQKLVIVQTDEFRPGVVELDVKVNGRIALNGACSVDQKANDPHVRTAYSCPGSSVYISDKLSWKNADLTNARFEKFARGSFTKYDAGLVLTTDFGGDKPVQQLLLCSLIVE